MYFYAVIFMLLHFRPTIFAHEATLCVNLCPPCLAQRVALECPPEPVCTEKVKEPGCGCCLVCALTEGERCGINLPACASGLKCLTKEKRFGIIEILENHGTCQHAPHTLISLSPEHTRSLHKSRRLKLRTRKRKRYPRHPHYGLLAPINGNGPCARHYETLMTSCGTLPARVWLPHCDKRGNYAPKQCMSSKGLQRGKCWCVNKNGHAIPETPYTEGPLFCYR
ncbi:insulin-like growth factor-binding protein 5 [Clavelina lepadiformis]|uniref:Insulin-like growth factor-binding protein 5 n=1 Tax=Clavelina lepadiformis TaxID=159417 RepID=A0ABP0GEA1_CLALP